MLLFPCVTKQITHGFEAFATQCMRNKDCDIYSKISSTNYILLLGRRNEDDSKASYVSSVLSVRENDSNHAPLS